MITEQIAVLGNGIRVTKKRKSSGKITGTSIHVRVLAELKSRRMIESTELQSLSVLWGYAPGSAVSAMAGALEAQVDAYRQKGTLRKVYALKGTPEAEVLRKFPTAWRSGIEHRGSRRIAPAPVALSWLAPVQPMQSGYRVKLIEKYEAEDGSVWDTPEEAASRTFAQPLEKALRSLKLNGLLDEGDYSLIAGVVAALVRDPRLKE